MEKNTATNRGLDSSHESDVRGEHRYSGIHQTPAERTARQNRDDLKRRLAEGRATAPDRGREEDRRRVSPAQRLIPGAYDRTTLTHRQPGSMGGPAFGSSDIAAGPSSMDAATIVERELEGGGVSRLAHR